MDEPRDAKWILRRLRAVPAGFVTTYGDLSPGAPRHAGRVLSECGDRGVPWQRAVRADGSLAKRERQRALLEAEGVPFRGARVAMEIARIPAEGLDDLTRPDDSPGSRAEGPPRARAAGEAVAGGCRRPQ